MKIIKYILAGLFISCVSNLEINCGDFFKTYEYKLKTLDNIKQVKIYTHAHSISFAAGAYFGMFPYIAATIIIPSDTRYIPIVMLLSYLYFAYKKLKNIDDNSIASTYLKSLNLVSLNPKLLEISKTAKEKPQEFIKNIKELYASSKYQLKDAFDDYKYMYDLCFEVYEKLYNLCEQYNTIIEYYKIYNFPKIMDIYKEYLADITEAMLVIKNEFEARDKNNFVLPGVS